MPKVAIVTGGASGLGWFITRRLVGKGAHVVVGDIDAVAGRQLVDSIEVEGGRATFVSTDASDANGVRSLVLQAAGLGELEVLINNAGGWLPGPQFPDSNRWLQSLDLNLRMPMLATQLCLPRMEAGGGGAVVNVASSGGLEPVGYRSPEYATAKAGLIRFTTAVRDAALRRKVRVSCVVPHWIGLDRAVREFEQMSPDQQADSGGLVDPETVADVVLQLSQDPQAAGRVVVLRPGHEPYAINPAAADPLWTESKPLSRRPGR
jgi:NAD(P)-dependent dehydrogenase (short-subunit alcohol dehydrogenase family)